MAKKKELKTHEVLRIAVVIREDGSWGAAGREMHSRKSKGAHKRHDDDMIERAEDELPWGDERLRASTTAYFVEVKVPIPKPRVVKVIKGKATKVKKKT